MDRRLDIDNPARKPEKLFLLTDALQIDTNPSDMLVGKVAAAIAPKMELWYGNRTLCMPYRHQNKNKVMFRHDYFTQYQTWYDNYEQSNQEYNLNQLSSESEPDDDEDDAPSAWIYCFNQ